MKAVLFLALTALALAGDEDLEIVLQSPKALMALFSQFNENFHKTFRSGTIFFSISMAEKINIVGTESVD